LRSGPCTTWHTCRSGSADHRRTRIPGVCSPTAAGWTLHGRAPSEEETMGEASLGLRHVLTWSGVRRRSAARPSLPHRPRTRLAGDGEWTTRRRFYRQLMVTSAGDCDPDRGGRRSFPLAFGGGSSFVDHILPAGPPSPALGRGAPAGVPGHKLVLFPGRAVPCSPVSPQPARAVGGPRRRPWRWGVGAGDGAVFRRGPPDGPGLRLRVTVPLPA